MKAGRVWIVVVACLAASLGVVHEGRAQCPAGSGAGAPPSPTGGAGASPPVGPATSGSAGSLVGGAESGALGSQPAGAGATTGALPRPRGRGERGPTSGGGGVRGRSARASSAVAAVTQRTFAEPWWQWWEMNRLQYIPPRRQLARDGSAAPTSSRYSFGDRLERPFVERMTAELRPLVERATFDDDVRVRARAAMTWGRLARRDAIPRLEAMLDDPSVHVRHCALLGLGATGELDATRLLLELVTDPKDARRVSAHASSVAMMGLAIGRHYGMPEIVERFVDDVLETVDDDDEYLLASAAFVYDALSPSERVRRHAMTVARDEDFDVIARCNALTALAKSGDVTAAGMLVDALEDGDVDVRRSAAIGLARHGDRPLVDVLTVALERETDAVAKGHLVVALGEQYDEAAGTLLVDLLRDGREAALRPWAALALGIRARRTGDVDTTCDVIHEALADESNADAHGAYLLACGIARDSGSIAWLRDELSSTGDPRRRVFAAQALALIDDRASSAALREQLERETWPYARAAIGQSLAYVGGPEDSQVVVELVRSLNDPTLQASAASAVGFLGSESALRGLAEVLSDERAPDEARGAALDGIGLMLGEQRGLLLADLTASANYTSFPSWIATLLGDVTL